MNNMRYDNIPEDLKVLHQWVCWRKHKCKDSKIPVTPGTDSNASVTDPTTWRDYDSALRWYQSRYYDGIGFVFSDNDPYCGIDLDSCRDTETGSINDKALDIIQRLSSYTEISQSGEGIHVIARAKLPAESGNKSGDFEMYDSVRYFCITGDRIDKYPSTIEDRQVQVNQLCNEIFSKPTPTRNQPQPAITITLSDHEIIDRANNAANGDKFMKLMAGDTTGYYHSDGSPDPSQADLALCSILAFWTQNADQIFRIVRNSGLYDDKWDREDYRNRTIKLALDTVKNHYSGNKGWSDMSVGLSEHKVVFHNTDMGNAKRLAYYYSDNIKYCHEMKTWFFGIASVGLRMMLVIYRISRRIRL